MFKYRIPHFFAIMIGVISIISPAVVTASATLTASQILDRTVTELSTSRNITCDFIIDVRDEKLNGTLKMSGEKFHLTLPGVSIWYDGHTLWSLDMSTKEVNITEPLPDELLDINPMAILSSLHNASVPKLLKGNNPSAYSLQLTPRPSRRILFRTAVIDINKKDWLPSKIILTSDSGQSILLKINSVTRGKNHPASIFVFNKKEYPGYAVIDLR